MKVNKSVTVNVPPDRAFEAFTKEIGSWWPLDKGFSFLGENQKEMFLEEKVGGRFFERGQDGTEYLIGEVRAYDPPSRVLLSWNHPDIRASTEVEVRFTEQRGATRVDLEHRGFEALGPKAEEEFKSYDGGWVEILRHYEKHAS
jgi:uncharacterized protein YndB with AHSA1/START domain